MRHRLIELMRKDINLTLGKGENRKTIAGVIMKGVNPATGEEKKGFISVADDEVEAVKRAMAKMRGNRSW